jgi:hypothetical protein
MAMAFTLLESHVMTGSVEIVDRGRGLQLSTSRVTVLDLVPYFQRGCSFDEITRWIPSLSHQEIAVVERYYRDHKDELDDQDRRLRLQREEQVLAQRLRFPEREESEPQRLARLQQLLEKRRAEKNGEGHSG